MPKRNAAFLLELLFFALAFLWLTGCDSVLSDVVVEDPGLLRVNLSMERAVATDGTLTEALQVTVQDKNHQYVRLQDARLTVNGHKLVHDTLFFIPTYRPAAEDWGGIAAGTPYELHITLADGETYTSTITTQQRLLTQALAPATHRANTDLTLQWQAADFQDPLRADVTTRHTDGSSDTYRFDLPDPTRGSFVISKVYFPATVRSVDVTLSSSKEAGVHEEFRSGRLKSTFRAHTSFTVSP